LPPALSDSPDRPTAPTDPQAEYQAEQERLDTLAMLSPAEAERQRQRASISFM